MQQRTSRRGKERGKRKIDMYGKYLTFKIFRKSNIELKVQNSNFITLIPYIKKTKINRENCTHCWIWTTELHILFLDIEIEIFSKKKKRGN